MVIEILLLLNAFRSRYVKQIRQLDYDVRVV